MNNKISASIMCANLLRLENDIKSLENAAIDYLHIDIMDGHFVPNLTFGPDTVNAIRKITSIPLDIHLLVENPKNIISSIDIQNNDIVTIHSECKDNIMEDIALIKNKGARFGLALNPDTTVENVTNFLPYTDVILLMLIVPGFAGSTMLHGMMEKVRKTKKFLIEHSYEDIIVAVDGSVSIERAQQLSSFGAELFVGGTSSIFNKRGSIETNTILLRNAIHQ